MTNRLKLSLFTNHEQIEQKRLYILQEEVKQFWENCTLIEMEQMMTIKQPRLVQHIWQYFSYYLTNKKNVSAKDAFCVKHRNSQQILMYLYDCRIFKSAFFEKQDNEVLSSFIMRYKQVGNVRQQNYKIKDLYQFLNPCLMENQSMIFKCKASCLLKVYSLFQQLNMQKINGDVIILPEQHYYKFIYSWTHYCQSWEVQPMIRHLFRGLMVLMQNQILLQFYKKLPEKQREIRRFEKPVCIFQKPKLKQTSTMVQEGLGDVEWNTLKISAFKLKYKVVEDQRKYICYRIKQGPSYHIRMHENIQQLDQTDQLIIQAFDKVLKASQQAEY